MEEDEIEQWYEDEKQKAMDDYLKELESARKSKISGTNSIGSKNHKEAEKIFNAKMEDITKRYNQLMIEKIGGKGKNNRFKDLIEKIKAKVNFISRK